MHSDSAKLMDDNEVEADLMRRSVKGGFWVTALGLFKPLQDIVRLLFHASLPNGTKQGLLHPVLPAVCVIGTFTQFGFSFAQIDEKDDTEVCIKAAFVGG